MPGLTLWTIGHSSQSFESFARLLAAEEIAFVADVRSYPYSRFAPQFNREELVASLREQGIGYVFLGAELGGRPANDEHYDEQGHALYGPMSSEPAFGHALDRLMAGVRDHRIALVCSEADPEHCHRRLLVGKVLAERGVELRHILPGGALRIEQRVALGGQGQHALFGEDETLWRSTRSVSHRRRLSASSAG